LNYTFDHVDPANYDGLVCRGCPPGAPLPGLPGRQARSRRPRRHLGRALCRPRQRLCRRQPGHGRGLAGPPRLDAGLLESPRHTCPRVKSAARLLPAGCVRSLQPAVKSPP
jgi:hypothetical protein